MFWRPADLLRNDVSDQLEHAARLRPVDLRQQVGIAGQRRPDDLADAQPPLLTFPLHDRIGQHGNAFAVLHGVFDKTSGRKHFANLKSDACNYGLRLKLVDEVTCVFR